MTSSRKASSALGTALTQAGATLCRMHQQRQAAVIWVKKLTDAGCLA